MSSIPPSSSSAYFNDLSDKYDLQGSLPKTDSSKEEEEEDFIDAVEKRLEAPIAPQFIIRPNHFAPRSPAGLEFIQEEIEADMEDSLRVSGKKPQEKIYKSRKEAILPPLDSKNQIDQEIISEIDRFETLYSTSAHFPGNLNTFGVNRKGLQPRDSRDVSNGKEIKDKAQLRDTANAILAQINSLQDAVEKILKLLPQEHSSVNNRRAILDRLVLDLSLLEKETADSLQGFEQRISPKTFS
jgi:hypothetical protein